MLGAHVAPVRLRLATVRVAGVRLARAMCALVLLVLIAGLCAALMPRPFGFRPTVVTSGSMGRSIPVGSLAMTRSVGADSVRQGDVILVREEVNGVAARPKLHRVVEMEQNDGSTLVTTKGDANAAPDPNMYVLPARVDVVAYSIPLLGYLVGFMLTPAGWVLAVGLPGAIVCAFVLRRIWSEGEGRRPVERAAPGFAPVRGLVLLGDLDHDSSGQARLPIARLLRSMILMVPRPSMLLIGVAVVAVTASAAAAAGYVMAPRAKASDGDARVAREATSLTALSARMAGREGYAADLELLRYADDPGLRAASGPEQAAALGLLLGGPANVFDALAVVDPSGQVIASTDRNIVMVGGTSAFRLARANGSVASSIDGPADGAAGTIDFAAPITSPNGGPSGVLLGRASAERVWAATLDATVDGGRNVIVDGKGMLIAGATTGELGQARDAGPTGLGALHVSIDGTPSVCASSAIGEGTHLDMGWRVASCLPASLAATGSTTSLRRDVTSMWPVVALAAAAVLIASTVLYAVARRGRGGAARRGRSPELEAIEARLHALESHLHAREA
jgi:signal peptidase